LQIATDILLIIQALVTRFLVVSSSLTLNDLELQNKGFSDFWQFLAAKSELPGNGWIYTKATCERVLL